MRDLNKGKVVRLSETRSGSDVILLMEGGGIRVKGVRIGRHFMMWMRYNVFSTLGVNHEAKHFGYLVEYVFS